MDAQGKMRPRAAIYVRVSGGPGQTTANQIPILTALCAQRDYEIVGIYNETASAVKARPVLDRLLADAHKGKIDVVVVFALDRLGRSLKGNLDLLLDLDRCGVKIVSYAESWLSMDGPVRSLLIAVFSWVAEQERTRVGQRARAGLARARARGIKLGRPTVTVDVARLLQLHQEGCSIRSAAKAVGIGASTAHRLISAHTTLALADGGRSEIPGSEVVL